MDNLTIGIYNENGKVDNYFIDAEILIGLYITFEPEKVDQNCKTFDITFGAVEPNNVQIKMSKREDVVIVSQKGMEVKLQYLVGPELNQKALQLLPSRQMSGESKKIIKEAFKLVKLKRLDSLNEHSQK